LELRHIRYFLAVAETLNFRRAAERLHISQPPLSTQIRLLEEELGVQLFDRSAQGTFLTPAGVVFQQRSYQILASVDAAVDDARQAADAKIGNLRVGWTASADFISFLPQAISQFRTGHPRVSITLTEMSSFPQIDAVGEGHLDIGIARKPEKPLSEIFELDEIWRDRLVLAVGRDSRIATLQSVRIEDLRDETFVAYLSDSGIGINYVLKDMCRRRGFEPRIEQEASATSMILGLVAAGVGIGLVPSMLEVERIRGVTFVPIDAEDAVCSIYAISRRANPNPFVRSFLDVLIKFAGGQKPA
jgi:DNA-binding transcriptional LysR family regulator